MKTKEEILIEFGCPNVPFDENVTMYYPAILSAMEEYAQQQVKNCIKPAVINRVAAPELLEALLSLMDGVANLPPLVAIDGVLKTEWEQGLKAINKALGK